MQLFYIWLLHFCSVPENVFYTELKNLKALFIELVFLLLYLFSAIACNLVICRKDV